MTADSTQVSTEFTGPGAADAAEVSLVLEQKPFPTDSGSIKTMQEIAEENGWQFVMAVGNLVISSDIELIYEAYYNQCGAGPDGSITATIYVFKTPQDLTYKLVANWGSFVGDPVTASMEREESVSFNLEQSVNLGYKVEELISIAWEGDVFDSSGTVIYPAVPSLSGNLLVTDQAVYGTIRIKYTVFGDTWELNIPKREDATSNEFQSTVLAFYGDNQVETLDVDGPNLTGSCDQSVQVCINSDCEQSADDEPVDDGSDTADGSSVALQLNAFDYCHGGAISGATFWIGGQQVPATGHTVKRGMTYSITVKASGYKDFTNSFSV